MKILTEVTEHSILTELLSKKYQIKHFVVEYSKRWKSAENMLMVDGIYVHRKLIMTERRRPNPYYYTANFYEHNHRS